MVAKLKMLQLNVTHLQLADVGYHVSEERVAGKVEGNTQALRGERGREGGGGSEGGGVGRGEGGSTHARTALATVLLG